MRGFTLSKQIRAEEATRVQEKTVPLSLQQQRYFFFARNPDEMIEQKRLDKGTLKLRRATSLARNIERGGAPSPIRDTRKHFQRRHKSKTIEIGMGTAHKGTLKARYPTPNRK